MNPTLETLLAHRSIRAFTDAPVPEADIRRAVEAGQAASTSSAVQAYCLLRITDPATRAELIGLTGGQAKVAECGAFFVVAGDVRRHRLAVEDAGGGYQGGLEGFLLAVIDATLFAQNMVVAFESLGYGICYIGGLRNDLPAVDRLLALPEGVYPFYGLCVGRPAETPDVRPRLPVDAVWFDDRYPGDDDMRARMAQYDETYRAYLRERGAKSIRGWSEIMGAKFSAEARETLAAYYTSKGATLGA